jgi:hypothetical protein
VADFIVVAARHGGAFVTAASPDDVIRWFVGANKVEVIRSDGGSAAVHPVFDNGNIGSEIVALDAARTDDGTCVTLTLEGVNGDPGVLNLNALGPIATLMGQVDEADPGWRPR